MQVKPILFNGDMVRAILDGRKTQTRRMFKLPKGFVWVGDDGVAPKCEEWPVYDMEETQSPFGRAGDRLWVRETFSAMGDKNGHAMPIFYRADGDDGIGWTPSIHMPRWASRITLEITAVRVERLQDISEDDAKSEGFDLPPVDNLGWKFKARSNFQFAWNSIYKNWKENPWVWVYEFKKF